MEPNVTPLTNSPLSQQSRQNIAGGGVVSGIQSVNSGQVVAQPTVSESDIKTLEVTLQNQQSLLGLQTGFNVIRQQISKLNTGLVNISTLLQNDIANDQRILYQEQNKEKILAEQGIREGKEKIVEQKISRAFTAASVPLSSNVRGLFDRIGQSLLYLFGGWMIDRYGKLIEADGKKNIDLVEKIKIEILRGIRNATNALLLFKNGLGLISNSIKGLAKFIFDILVVKPFNGLKELIKGTINLGKVKSPPGGKPTGKPSTKGKPTGRGGGFGAFLTGLGAFMEAWEGNWVEAGLGAGAIILKGKTGAILGTIYTFEQLLDIFGQGLIPENEDSRISLPSVLNKVTGSKDESEDPNQWWDFLDLVPNSKSSDEESGNVPANTNNESLQTESDVTEPEPEHKSTSSTSANNNVIPQSNIIQKPKPSNNTSKGTSEVEPQELVLKNETPPPQKNEGLNKSNETPPPQKNEGLNKSNETPPPQKNEGLNESTGSTSGGNSTLNLPIFDTPEISQDVSVPAVIESPPPKDIKISKLSDPKPTIIQTNNQTQRQQSTNLNPNVGKSITGVPLIKSSNPENFYTLYALHSYNVVA